MHNILEKIYWWRSGDIIYVYVSVTGVLIDSGNGLLPVWHKTIIWTDVEILLTGHRGINMSEIQINIW